MTLSENAVSIIAVVAVAIAALSLLMNLALGRRVARMGRDRKPRIAERGELDTPAGLSQEIVSLSAEVAALHDALQRSVQRIGLVRFDAFEDMGGHLSFAAALLDGNGDGVVLSSINGRSETRMYAKPVEAGASRYNLSTEEEEAIRRALGALRR